MVAEPGQPAPDGAPEWRSEEPPGGWDAAIPGEDQPNRKIGIVAGALAIVAGLVAIFVPALASVGTAVFIGIVLLLTSLPLALGAIAAPGLRHKVLRGLAAGLTFAAGLYLLVSPLEGTFTLTVMLVIWFVAVGVLRIATGIAELGEPGAGYTILAGAISLLLGVLIAVELPSSADWAIGLLVGIDFIVYGLLCLGQALLPGR